MLQAVKGLLSRPQSLKMAPIQFDVRRHPGRDSGCRIGAADYLHAFLDSYRYAMVMFDLDGSGSHESRAETQREVEGKLNSKHGFGVCQKEYRNCSDGMTSTPNSDAGSMSRDYGLSIAASPRTRRRP